MLGADSRKSSLFWFDIAGPPLFSTHVLIQVMVLWHGEEGREGGEVEEQQNLSEGVDSALRNGPESKTVRRRQQEVVVILVWHPLEPPSFFTHVLIQVIVLHHGEEGREGREVEE